MKSDADIFEDYLEILCIAEQSGEYLRDTEFDFNERIGDVTKGDLEAAKESFQNDNLALIEYVLKHSESLIKTLKEEGNG